MKQALCLFSCDGLNGWDDCGDESPPETTFAKARVAARTAGWWLGPGGAALCPEHVRQRGERLRHRPNGASGARP